MVDQGSSTYFRRPGRKRINVMVPQDQHQQQRNSQHLALMIWMVELCTSRVLALSLLFGLPSLLSCAAGPLFLEVPGVPVPSSLSAARSAVRPEAIDN